MDHFVIVTEARTGYQFLLSTLREHPDVMAFGEIFVVQPLNGRLICLFGTNLLPCNLKENHLEYISNVLDPYAVAKNRKIVGFKIDYRNSSLRIESIKDYKIIHLTRDNLLDRFISQKLAMKENNWNYNGYKTKVTVEVEELIHSVNSSLSYRKRINDNHNVHSVIYEELAEHTTDVVNGVLEYLGVTKMPLSSPMTKQRVGPQSQYIENYKELCISLSGTSYANYLTG